jgi:NAD(P)-dependent dehydrogenase (short-subunit alcohol dehydrogenase family)
MSLTPIGMETGMLLEGKSVVVTGGNSGIGKAIVLAAAAEGANVVVDYLMHPEYAAEVVAAAGRSGGRAVGVEADVSPRTRPGTSTPPRSPSTAACRNRAWDCDHHARPRGE